MDQFFSNEIQGVKKFCKKHGFSKAFFYKQQSEGKGPKTSKMGRLTIITPKNEYEWILSLDDED